MAKVEMSLNEYDAIKKELELYKGIVTRMFTVKLSDDDYYFNRIKNGETDSIFLQSDYTFTTEENDVITDIINKSVPTYLTDIPGEVRVCTSTYNTLALYNVTKEESTEACND